MIYQSIAISPPPRPGHSLIRTGAFYQKINYAATVNVILYPAIIYPKAFPPRRPRDVYRITIILPQITPGRSSNPRGLNQIKTAISYLLKIRNASDHCAFGNTLKHETFSEQVPSHCRAVYCCYNTGIIWVGTSRLCRAGTAVSASVEFVGEFCYKIPVFELSGKSRKLSRFIPFVDWKSNTRGHYFKRSIFGVLL